ncbi:MAG: hypothetical protein CM15mP120_15120 [Pseudomonadota bacterium]|nr:MAG: hypothetical protein CM15mP120_15120 [Pseudomonadota bacterium]
MLLRASGEQTDQPYQLDSLTHAETQVGVACEKSLRDLTDAAIRGEWETLAELRDTATKQLSAQQVTDALVVASAFNGITRVADATGIPLDPHTEATTLEMREQTGIQRYDYSEKSTRYDG